MRRLIILAIFCLISCEDDQNPFIAELTNTSWTIVNAKLIENGAVMGTLPPNPSLHHVLSFRENKLVQISDFQNGCGEWTMDNSNLKFKIYHGEIVPDLCDEGNFNSIFVCDSRIELIAPDTLLIHGLGGTFNHFYYLPDWNNVRDDVRNGKSELRTYFVKTGNAPPAPPACCAKL